MNILIVDDEIYIVRALKAKIHWEALGIAEVFTALNIARAKEILSSEPVDILLTDIEMPGGTGLELMEWVRAEGLQPVSPASPATPTSSTPRRRSRWAFPTTY